MSFTTDDGHTYHIDGHTALLEEDPAANTATMHYDRGTGRQCGDCQLCCKLLPIPEQELAKPANQRCKHQHVGKGCGIYKTRPLSCRSWFCRWMADPRAHDLPRPDRCHYVVDTLLDNIVATNNETANVTRVPAIQVWVDPAYPHAHRDPRLRRYLEMMAQMFGYTTLIRYSESEAFVLAAPRFSGTGKWEEIASAIMAKPMPRRPPTLITERRTP